MVPELVDVLLQETAHDSGHANLDLAGMGDGAETARRQGLDWYADDGGSAANDSTDWSESSHELGDVDACWNRIASGEESSQ